MTVSLCPWALGPLTVLLWAIISSRFLNLLIPYRNDVFLLRVGRVDGPGR